MTGIRLTPALIAIDALLAVALAALWLAPGPSAHWRNWQTPAPQAPNLDDARAAQLIPNPALRHDYPAITERPLFAADRKPRAAASDAQTAAAPPPDSLDQAKLYGLVDGPSSQGVLLEQGGQPQFVRIGEKVGDWTLQAIQNRDAVFVKGGEKRTVSLPDSLNDAAANAPAGSATAPTPTPAANSMPAVPQPGLPAVPHPMPGRVPRPAPPPALPGLNGAQGAHAQPQPAAPAVGGLQPAAQRGADF
jgi:general secretion pathway protein N